MAERAFALAERTLARQTDALIAVSAAVRDELLELGIGRRSQWYVIPVGVDLDHLVTDGRDPAESRQLLRLPTTGPIVGMIGRLVSIKDPGTFIEAAARVLLEFPQVTFAIAGSGPLRQQLERRARSVLGHRVQFLGWVSDLSALYSAMDAVVRTSRNEGTPVALVEAGAAAKPVVATHVGGVPEVVRHGETGIIVPPGNPTAVASAIIRLLSDSRAAAAMGKRARGAVSRFSMPRLASDTANLYTELLARKRSSTLRTR
jgi:glycosyltransferase involved in cell wall biosynthesis